MINFLHTFIPNPVLINIGPFQIFWYGFFIVLGIIIGLTIAIKLGEFYNVDRETILDCAFYLILAGIVGARIYHVFLEYSYYIKQPLDIFKVWNGGLAIHGAIIAGAITLWILAKKKNLNIWLLCSIAVPGLALAQTLGRWGNYFNQELYGAPTDLPWGIPIALKNRLPEYLGSSYFHPTFLYESIGSLIIFGVLIWLHYSLIKKNKFSHQHIVLTYLFLYSLLRFLTETIRIDPTIIFLGLRLPQLVSLFVMIFVAGYFTKNYSKLGPCQK